MVVSTTNLPFPTEQALRLQQSAKAMGLEVPAYVEYLEQCRGGRLDAKAQDAARFMFAKHSESLRKLAR